jgi:hypothetical protein
MTTLEEPAYAVVWPLAPPAATAGTMAVRPYDLDGKCIGELWDYLFKGEEIFPLIRAALKARYPGVSFVPYDKLGNIHGRDEAELAANLPILLRQHGVDAVIAAIGA